MIKRNLLLLVIVLFATVIRVIDLENTPSGFHNDEASFLVNAVALLETGKDEDGQTFPLFLKSYIDPKPALYSYLQIPFVAVLGPSITAARLPAAILGVISVIAFAGVLSQLKVPRGIQLLSVLVVSISPWHIILSRGAQEVILSICFGLLSIWALLWAFKSKSLSKAYFYKLLLFSTLALVSVYSYHSTKVVLPLLVAGITFFTLPEKQKYRQAIFTGALVLGIALVVQISGSDNSARFNAVSIFSEGRPQLILEEQIRTATGEMPGLLLRVFHNKVVNYGLAVSDIYLQHFSPAFLFSDGFQPKRYLVPEHGLLYLLELPLIVLGMIMLIKESTYRRLAYIVVFWILISPLAAAVTVQEVPSAIRAAFMVFPLSVLSAFGLLFLYNSYNSKYKKLAIVLVIALAYLWSFSYFLNQYAVQQTLLRPWNRNYADEQMAKGVAELRDEYETISISRYSGQPYVYLVLNSVISIRQLQESYPARTQSTFSIGTITFTDSNCLLDTREKTLFVIHQNCDVPSNKGYQVLRLASHKDGNDGYVFIEWKNLKSEIVSTD